METGSTGYLAHGGWHRSGQARLSELFIAFTASNPLQVATFISDAITCELAYVRAVCTPVAPMYLRSLNGDVLSCSLHLAPFANQYRVPVVITRSLVESRCLQCRGCVSSGWLSPREFKLRRLWDGYSYCDVSSFNIPRNTTDRTNNRWNRRACFVLYGG